MANPLPYPLPADLPEDWTNDQIVAPNGADVGLTEQHGYNYLAKQVNAAQADLQAHAGDAENPHQVNLDQLGAVGRSMAGQSVEPEQGTIVVAGEWAEVFNDYRPRQFIEADKSVKQGNVASGFNSHAEGSCSTASGLKSHAEGGNTIASGNNSHAEGYLTEALGVNSHAEGIQTKANATSLSASCHAEGSNTTASGSNSHSEGSRTSASGSASHAEGSGTIASGSASHAEGSGTIASGSESHSEGMQTKAPGNMSHAAGNNTIANCLQFVIGEFNVESGTPSGTTLDHNYFIIGAGGTNTSRKNVFRVNKTGNVYGGTYNSSGADYAELFEWLDLNPDQADRAGLFVTLDGEHIRVAGPGDNYILGIVSACPSVVGDVYDDQWAGMHLRDVFGRTIYKEQDFPAELLPDGTVIREGSREKAPVLNPDYDPATPYIPRTQRPEWAAVGMMGKLVAVDDGTCEPNGYCTVGKGGVATRSQERTPYRVMARLDETHIRVLIR